MQALSKVLKLSRMVKNPIRCPSSAQTERKLIERNRRQEMNSLFSRLNSLVPHQSSRAEARTVPDQLENATNYIKEMQSKLEKLKEKRDKAKGLFLSREHGTTCASEETKPSLLLLQVEAHAVGPSIEVLLATGSDYHFILRQILSLLQQNRAEILNLNQSMFPDRVLHKIVAQVGGEEGLGPESGSGDGERICEIVKKFASQYKDGQCSAP